MKIRIVKGATKISSKGDIIFHTFGGDMEFNALGRNDWHGEKGNEVGNYEEMPISLQPNLNRCIVEFRPPKNYDWNFGFDWMREGKAGDNKINFKNLCSSNFDGLQREYKAKKLELGLWKNKPKDKEYSYDSWLALYPPNAQNYGSKTATLSYSDEGMKASLKVVYDKTYFKINNESLPPLKKSNKGQLLENALTIECIAGFSTEQEIKIMTEENQEVGCLRVVPNDDAHRYKLKIRLVKVYLLEEDMMELSSVIKKSDIQQMLRNGVLSQCFLRPIV